MQTPARQKHLAPLLALLLAVAAPCHRAVASTIIADFTGGTGTTDASHQFEGASGEGWKTAWSKSQTNATVGTGIGANDWLNVSISSTSSSPRSSFNRAYDSGSTATIDTTKAYSISFSLRFDDLSSFTAAGDYIGIFDAASQLSSSSTGGNTNSWALIIQGDDKKIQLGNGTWDNKVTLTKTGFDSPDNTLTIAEDINYAFTINIDPDSRSWTVAITPEGGSTVSSTASLGFRSNAADLGTTGRYFHINTLQNAASETLAYSFSGLTISQIPEPALATTVLAALAALACAAMRRHR